MMSTTAPSAPPQPKSPITTSVPHGFEPYSRGGPYLRALGPVYTRHVPGSTMVIAVRVDPAHTNSLGLAHGGMLLTLADGTMGDCVGTALSPPDGARKSSVTTTLTTEFFSAARIGDWLEAHASIRRKGRRIIFAECVLRVGEREVLHASGTFVPVEG